MLDLEGGVAGGVTGLPRSLSGKVAVTDVAGGSADGMKSMNSSIESVSSEEIAAATVDSDVAVGKGSNHRLGSGVWKSMERRSRRLRW